MTTDISDISGNHSKSSLQSASEEPPSGFTALAGCFSSKKKDSVFLRSFCSLFNPFFLTIPFKLQFFFISFFVVSKFKAGCLDEGS